MPRPNLGGPSTDYADEIRRALKAVDLMKILDGQKALGNKSNTKQLGEHKVSLASYSIQSAQ